MYFAVFDLQLGGGPDVSSGIYWVGSIGYNGYPKVIDPKG